MEKCVFHLIAPAWLTNSLQRCNENKYLRWGFKYLQEVILSRCEAAVRPIKPRFTSRHYAGRVIPQKATPSLLAASAERSLANKFTQPASALALDFRRCWHRTFSLRSSFFAPTDSLYALASAGSLAPASQARRRSQATE